MFSQPVFWGRNEKVICEGVTSWRWKHRSFPTLVPPSQEALTTLHRQDTVVTILECKGEAEASSCTWETVEPILQPHLHWYLSREQNPWVSPSALQNQQLCLARESGAQFRSLNSELCWLWGPFGCPGQTGKLIHNHSCWQVQYPILTIQAARPENPGNHKTPSKSLTWPENQASSPVQPSYTPYNFRAQAVALPTKTTLMASPTCPRGLPAHISTIPSWADWKDCLCQM